MGSRNRNDNNCSNNNDNCDDYSSEFTILDCYRMIIYVNFIFFLLNRNKGN